MMILRSAFLLKKFNFKQKIESRNHEIILFWKFKQKMVLLICIVNQIVFNEMQHSYSRKIHEKSSGRGCLLIKMRSI